MIRWLQLSGVTILLTDIATGTLPVSYAALDALPRSRAVWFVEHLLTVSGLLPGRDPVLARFELWIADWLDGLDVAEHELILRRYVTWVVLRRLRAASSVKWLSDAAHNGAKTRLKASRDLLAYVHQKGRSFADCRQSDVDTWAATRPKSRARAARPFWRWSVEHDLAPAGLTYAIAPDVRPSARPADAEHWDRARQLFADADIAVHVRVAGLLVLLYAQPVAKITRLTLADVVISPSAVAVRLGRSPITVPGPLATLIRQLAQPEAATTAGRLSGATPWLLRGQHPGRPIHPAYLTKRLASIGVPVGVTRTAGLAHLAASMPAAVVADLLGIHVTTTAMWARAVGGTWSSYTSHRLGSAPAPPAAGVVRRPK